MPNVAQHCRRLWPHMGIPSFLFGHGRATVCRHVPNPKSSFRKTVSMAQSSFKCMATSFPTGYPATETQREVRESQPACWGAVT